MRTTITVVKTATEDSTMVLKDSPRRPATTLGNCNPMSRNAKDSSSSCTAFHTASSCSRVA
ncbi:Uncharacterised protein [Mycobacteroides abscessus subsp. abscessus]|nr:Uncharacterised protein [Mycobacteroides abscessus subsp. abscessus]SHW81774.1 Uncharacterised protein [Mycobacteroides abscessus subsp. abscessus]SIL96267.1 Uncharacterised protein [Mycobacteroides abscessus subsp. abscessus]